MQCELRTPLMALALSITACGAADAQEIRHHSFGNALEALVVSIDGKIEPGFADRFRAFLQREAPEGYQVVLNSPGGVLIEGLKLGYILRENGYHTRVGRIVYTRNSSGYEMPEEVDGDCSSACSLAFLGGKVRDVRSAAKLGFHQFYGGAQQAALSAASRTELHAQSQSATQLLSGVLVQYIVEMGVDARIFTTASGTRPEAMTYLTQAEAISYNVVTPQGFGTFFIEPYRDGIVAASRRNGPTRAYDQVRQTTIFCPDGRPGHATILLTADGTDGMAGRISASNADLTAHISTRDISANAQSFPAPASRVAVRGSGQDIFFEIAIGAEEIRALLRAAYISVRIDTPRASGGYGAWHDLTEQDRRMIRSAFMHCI